MKKNKQIILLIDISKNMYNQNKQDNKEVEKMEIKINYCGGKQQERMIENGWTLKLAEFRETPEELYKRLITKGYKQIKIYWIGTRIRGIHDYFAFVK